MFSNSARPPQIVAFAGPKGGVGCSTLATEFARTLAKHEQKVLLVDFDKIRQGLTFTLEIKTTFVQKLYDFQPQATSIDNVDVVLLEIDAAEVGLLCQNLKRKISYNWIILDLPADFSLKTIRCFLDADLPILVSSPDKSSVFAATQWIRACIEHTLQQNHAMSEIVTKMNIVSNHSKFWTIPTLMPSLTLDERNTLKSIVSRMHFAFLLNMRREGSEMQQSETVCHAWSLLLGPLPQPLGTIIYEERRWFYTRGFAPSMGFPREESILADVESIVRELLAKPSPFGNEESIAWADPVTQPRTYLRATTIPEARQNYRKLWEGYRRENGLVSMVLDEDTSSEVIKNLETALKHSTLEEQNLERHHHSQEILATEPMTRKLSGTFSMSSWSLNACQPTPGLILQSKREELGKTQREISLQTRIPLKQLENIEHSQLENISPTYLRAYLFELSKALGIPLSQLHQTFGFSR